ncbi:hypothetical protein SAMN05428985_101272 [Nocardioides sp. YR527]|uniref:hypothetical protein n=1 Tax=Nocardioides sp. YR527 TaxID=1881028 RepID=UPI000881A300|nr:hypothetical protein [Nocardioides sp. YR527]SDJ75210.1 hypothetical protein SAMN05428985_101272 [Nocardioides sp. YR527]
MTTSRPRSTLTRIINSGWATAGAVAAVPLAGAAVATGAWGWAVGAVGALALGSGAATLGSRDPRPDREPGPPRGPEGRPIHTYYFLSETRVAMLHAQLFRGKVGSRLREIVRTSSGGAEAGIDVPPVKAVTRYAREIAKKYTEEAQPTNETLVGDVLAALQVRGLLHEPDADLDLVAALVSRTDTDDQFLQFNVAGPDLRQAVLAVPAPVGDGPDNTATLEQKSHGLTITMHVGSRGKQEDFDELEHRDNVVVVGVLRSLDTGDRTATVRVIAVY